MSKSESAPSRNALVTGASRGIGAAIARRLARDGFRVWINYRESGEAAEGVLKEIESEGGDGLLLPFDVASPEAVDAALTPLLKSEGPLAVLVNNAGMTRDGLVPTLSDEDWGAVLEAGLSGPFRIMRAAIRGMLKARNGRIVNIVSVAGQAGNPGQANYSAAKAGLIGLTKAVAREYAKRNILVNAVAPGFIETDMTAGLPKDEIVAQIPLQRAGLPDEVAGAVSFLCSADASYITGQVIGVNGGMVTS